MLIKTLPIPPYPHPAFAQVQVSDTGKGIDPDFLSHVFDYFRQADSTTTRKFGGLGLGLAIVRQIVELHGGTVQAESLGEGQGTTFKIRLPLLTATSEPNREDILSCDRFSLKGLQVLLVDDDTDTREFVAFLLKQEGVVVIAAASASETLIILSQTKPNLLISDIGMPDTDGYMLMRQVRSMLPQSKQIPAIALTAYAGETNEQQGFGSRFSKPCLQTS
jgi:CheY-like chemotaxis protein